MMVRSLCFFLLLTLSVSDAGKLFYKLQQATVDDTLCPDKASKCPATATCCQLEDNKWGCCPFVQATCCSDNIHCCPSDHSCNPEKGECVQSTSNSTIAWAKKEAAVFSSEKANPFSNGLLCPDRVSTCLGTASCCPTKSGEFKCCNYPNDVCCADGLSCCPRSSICDLVNKRCISGFQTTDWASLTPSEPSVTAAFVKIPAKKVTTSNSKELLSGPLGNVRCDSTHYCPDGTTCCWTPSGWGCCPLPRAVCCWGSTYCCPNGRSCTNPPGGCV